MCPTGSGQVRLWAGICALFVPAFRPVMGTGVRRKARLMASLWREAKGLAPGTHRARRPERLRASRGWAHLCADWRFRRSIRTVRRSKVF